MNDECDERKINWDNGFVSNLREWYQAVPTCIRLSAVVLLVIAIFIPGALLGADPEPPDRTVRVKLNQVTPSVFLSETPEIALTAFLEVDPLQPDVGRGLHFALVISNEGQARVDLIDRTKQFDDIFESLINLQITNEDAVRVDLPNPPSVGQVHTNDTDAFRAEWSPRRQLQRVDEPARPRSDTIKTPGNADDGIVTLAPSEQYRVAYRVTHILGAPKQYNERKTAIFRGEVRPEPGEMERPPMSVIRPGRYGISVYVQVVGRLGEKKFNRYFELQEPLSVRLGQE